MTGKPDVLDQSGYRTEPLDVTPVQLLAVELAIAAHARDLDDQRFLTRALGLDEVPRPRTWNSALRRAVPDGFRRTRKPGGRHG